MDGIPHAPFHHAIEFPVINARILGCILAQYHAISALVGKTKIHGIGFADFFLY